MKLGVVALTLWLTVISTGQDQTAVPFRLIDGWAIMLEGTLGGVPHQELLVDTGAVPSAINSRVVKRLKLAGQVQQLSVMNRAIGVERVRVPEVRVGAVSVESLDMVAMDLNGIEQALGTRIDAVIGLDLLARQNFTLDYRHKKLIFDANVVGTRAIPFEVRHEAGGTYILISLESDGERLKLLMDTGTSDLMLFQQKLPAPLRHLHTLRQKINLNAGGRDRLSEVEMQSVNVGSFSRHKQKAYVWPTSEDELRDFDGLLGPAALGATVVGFDFDRDIISFETESTP